MSRTHNRTLRQGDDRCLSRWTSILTAPVAGDTWRFLMVDNCWLSPACGWTYTVRCTIRMPACYWTYTVCTIRMPAVRECWYTHKLLGLLRLLTLGCLTVRATGRPSLLPDHIYQFCLSLALAITVRVSRRFLTRLTP